MLSVLLFLFFALMFVIRWNWRKKEIGNHTEKKWKPYWRSNQKKQKHELKAKRKENENQIENRSEKKWQKMNKLRCPIPGRKITIRQMWLWFKGITVGIHGSTWQLRTTVLGRASWQQQGGPLWTGVAVSLNAGGDRLRQPASWCAGWIFGGNWRQTRAIQWARKIGQVRLYALHGGFSETTKSSNWFESRGLKYIHKHRGDNLPPLVLRDHHNMPLWHIWEFARDITWMWLESCA